MLTTIHDIIEDFVLQCKTRSTSACETSSMSFNTRTKQICRQSMGACDGSTTSLEGDLEVESDEDDDLFVPLLSCGSTVFRGGFHRCCAPQQLLDVTPIFVMFLWVLKVSFGVEVFLL